MSEGEVVSWRENSHVMEMASLKKREWLLEVASLMEENGHVTEVDRLREGEWSCYCGHFNVRENGHVTEVVGLKKGEWLL